MPKLKSVTDPKAFWDLKASSFPRYSPGEDNYEASVLDLARRNGIRFQGAHVLDVGCGTGMFTIRVAKEAWKVTALDISGKMLDILEADARKAGASNITLVNSDWLDYQPPEAVDLAFCSMTPALHTEAGRQKVISLKGAQGCAMVGRERFRSKILDALLERYACASEFPKAPELASLGAWLEGRGISPTALPVTGQWRIQQSLDELLDSAKCSLFNFGVEPEEDELRDFLLQFQEPDGEFVELTDYNLEMLIWRNP